MDAVRTCVACREHAVRDELLRVVLQGDRLVVDDRAVLPGRGAWVHPTNRCLNHAVSRGAFARALRASVPIDASPLENWMRNTHGQLMSGSK
ncbi:MAG: YlxR family protein [Leucobacter sp.]